MRLDHIAVTAHSEKRSDRFFIALLGLEKTRNFTVSAEMMKALFGIERDTRVVRYSGGPGLEVEVFIAGELDPATGERNAARDRLTHACLIVSDRRAFAENAKAMGFQMAEVPKADGSSLVMFVSDDFGNRYEIK